MPTFVNEVETAWNTSTSPKTTGSIDVEAGDFLVCIGIINSNDRTISTPTNSGTALTWTQQQFSDSTNRIYLWTAPATANESITVSAVQPSAAQQYGIVVYAFRSSAGIGASSKHTTAQSGVPSLDITTTRPNSIVVFGIVDDVPVDGASRAYLTNAGAATERMYFLAAGRTHYSAYHANSGAIATYAVGLSAPGSQLYQMVAVELLGPVLFPTRTKYMTGGIVE